MTPTWRWLRAGMNKRWGRLDNDRSLIVVAIAQPVEGHPPYRSYGPSVAIVQKSAIDRVVLRRMLAAAWRGRELSVTMTVVASAIRS